MNKWINTSPEDRLKMWKDFRNETKGSDTEQLMLIAEFYGDMPFAARTIDFHTPSTWPTPWEILYSGMFCQNTISVLIYHTLKLNPLFADRVSMCIVKDPSDMFVAPIIDNKYLLNYILNEVQDVTADTKIEYQKIDENDITPIQ